MAPTITPPGLPAGAVPERWNRRVITGLSTGEGIIAAVRDGGGLDERGKPDPGVLDKRRLVREAEFASALTLMQRPGNILSPIIRELWDGGTVQTLTKHTPIRASGAHVSIIGHITSDELARVLNKTELSNGFANRFLFVHVSRSRLLPDGGRVDAGAFGPLVTRLQEAIAFSATVTEMHRDDATRALWHQEYGRLERGEAGAVGKVLSRAAAQVLRLSCVYALLDLSHVVHVEHLRAALAFWRYSEDSARAIFNRTLSPHAVQLREFLISRGASGATRTEIQERLSNNARKDEIEAAIEELQRWGYHLQSTRDVRGPGRPATRWTLTSMPAGDEGEEPRKITIQPQPEALYGLAGDFVRLIEPNTEAAPMALLSQFLAAFGNVVGRGPYFPVEATRHYLNMFVVLVGDTGSGRKGTSWDHINHVFEVAEASESRDAATTAASAA